MNAELAPGALTTYFASLVAPSGFVRTFEQREDFFEIAGKNIEKSGMKSFVRMEQANLIGSAVEENEYDLVMLDTGDPWTLLETAHKALKGSGFVFCICPTTNQLENVAFAMEGKFVDVECIEILFRRMEAESWQDQAIHENDWAYMLSRVRQEGQLRLKMLNQR